MNKSIKKMLATGVSLLLFAGVGISFSNMSNNKAHAESLNTAMAELRSESYQDNLNARKAQNEIRWNHFKEWQHEPHKTYNQIINSGERPLSEIYPHGHWNGESDIKGDNTNYKKKPRLYNVLGHKVDYRAYKYYQKEQHKIRILKSKVKKQDAKYNAIKKLLRQSKNAKSYDKKWIKKHSYMNGHMKVSKYKSLSRKYFRRAYTLDDQSSKIALTNSYRQALRASKSNSKYHYKIVKVVNPNTQPVFAKIINPDWYIYKIKFNNHYYYYGSIGVRLKYFANLKPYNTETVKGNLVHSNVAPNSKHVVLKPGTKFKQNMMWSSDSNVTTTYYLHGKTWKIDKTNSPEYDDEL